MSTEPQNPAPPIQPTSDERGVQDQAGRACARSIGPLFARTPEYREEELLTIISARVVSIKARAERAEAELANFDADWQKIIKEVLECNPIPACKRDDGRLEPPWEVVARIISRITALELSEKALTEALEKERTFGLQAFWLAQAAWSQSTFGTDAERGPLGPLKHLAKEAQEAQRCPGDLMEFVDCLFLTFDATRRAGFTFQQLQETAWKKLAINKARRWQKSTKSDEAVEHDRSGEAQPLPVDSTGEQGREGKT